LKFATDVVVIEFAHGRGVHESFEERIRAAVMLVDYVAGMELDKEGVSVEAHGGDGR